MVGLTKKAEELPAQKAGVTTSTGPQVTAAAHTCITLHARLLVPSNTMFLSCGPYLHHLASMPAHA